MSIRAVRCTAIEAMQSNKVALLESPTGTGKSLALLAAVLGFQCAQVNWVPERRRDPYHHHNEEPRPQFGAVANPPEDWEHCTIQYPRLRVPQIWFCSGTHAQLKQVGELKKLRAQPGMTILAARSVMCRVESVRRADAEDACRGAREVGACKYMEAHRVPAPLLPGGRLGKFELEELMEFCEAHQPPLCSYLLARRMMPEAELVIAPYPFLLNPKVKGQMMLSVLNAVVVLDESHNLESAICEETGLVAKRSEVHGVLRVLLDEVKAWGAASGVRGHEVGAVRHILSRVLHYVESHEGERRPMSELLGFVGITQDSWPQVRLALDQFFVAVNSGRTPTGRPWPMGVGGVVEQFYVVAALCLKSGGRFAKSFVVDLTDSQTLKIWSLSPGAFFTSVADEAGAVLLASGTLRPMEQFAPDLGREPGEVVVRVAGHAAPTDQLRVYGLRTQLNSSWGTRQQAVHEISEELGEVLLRLMPVQGNVLVFVPSYALLEVVSADWVRTGLVERVGRPVYFEEREGRRTDWAAIRRTLCVVCGVYRGRLAEGIDFRDDEARLVVAFGIPFSPRGETYVVLKRQYLDERGRRGT